jgi:hypothetical protein
MKPKNYPSFSNKKFILNPPLTPRDIRNFQVKKFKFLLIKNYTVYEIYRKQDIKNKNRSFYFK